MLRQFLTLLFVLTPLLSSSAAEPPDFSEDIRPILSNHCFQCHGPDRETLEADLRMDQPESAFEDRGGYAAVVPGKADESEMMNRVRSDDPDLQMPPPHANKPLSQNEIDLLEAWIEAGAPYEKHWSFVPPKSPQPSVSETHWSNSPLDAFVERKHADLSLAPQNPATRAALARRLSLDLIGLPPSAAEVLEFEQDLRPDATQRYVDRLLASPRYGERWARQWLDLARYSDTNGYEKDRPRSMWPYRDWVIEAINRDLSFRDFSIDQLAGDLKSQADLSDRIATGFHRNTMVNEEGGVDPQEYRYLAVVDRVATTGTTWLGLTLGCCQCHTHKFDPITHTDYFQLFALFNNANELTISLPDPATDRRREQLLSEIQRLEARLEREFPQPPSPMLDHAPELAHSTTRKAVDRAFLAWVKQVQPTAVDWKPLSPLSWQTDLPTIQKLDDESLLVTGDVTKLDVYDVVYELEVERVTHVRLEAMSDERLPFRGPGRATIDAGVERGGDFFLSDIRVEYKSAADGAKWQEYDLVTASHSFAGKSRDSQGAIDGKSDTAWGVVGRTGEDHWAVFELSEPIEVERGGQLRVRYTHESFFPASLGRFRLSATDSRTRIQAFDRPVWVDSKLAKPFASLPAAEMAKLRRYFLKRTPYLASLQKRIRSVESQIPKSPQTLVMQERLTHPRMTQRHHRGEYLNPREAVSPGLPDVLNVDEKSQPKNRLQFAEWLFSEDNPLVARVTVNRDWHALFGRGLSKTLDDFGTQGEFPSHPQLLDWLAVDFAESGWSRKRLHRQIVLSATYGQASNGSQEEWNQDPENQWLARGPRKRLEAEALRDAALSVSGLLTDRIGGPSVFPSQDPSITATAYGGFQWKISQGADRFRRGLYTYNKRTAPFANFMTFDGPSGEACIARRNVTNTPLQALTLLNHETYQDCARAFAGRAFDSYEQDQDRIDFLYREALSRSPNEAELQAMQKFVADQRKYLSQHPTLAEQLVKSKAGVIHRHPEGDVIDQAAWTMVARVILNLDEFIVRP